MLKMERRRRASVLFPEEEGPESPIMRVRLDDGGVEAIMRRVTRWGFDRCMGFCTSFPAQEGFRGMEGRSRRCGEESGWYRKGRRNERDK